MTSYIYDMVDTWNAGATTFTSIKMNVTDTASAAGSLLMDLQVGGTSRFQVKKDGQYTVFGATVNDFIRVSSADLYVSTNATGGRFLIAANDGGGLSRFVQSSTGYFGWSNNSNLNSGANPDTILTRRAAANLRLGAADAAAPVAQTLSVQSVVAGTTNTAGANLTITGSQGTGTGAGGSIIFQVAPAGSSGTAQNALQNALLIDHEGQATFTVKNTSGSPTIQIVKSGSSGVGITASSGLTITSNGAFILSSTSPVYAAGAYLNIGTGAQDDVRLYRDAANTLALRNGANAQESRVYGSYTSATNFQRMSIKTLRESSGALSGASYTTTIAIPAYANLIGVTTRVTTEVTGATTYDVGDGTDVDLWGAAIGIALGSQSQTSDFTAVGAVGAAATSRTVTLTANGSNFTGGVVEICLHYLTTEAD